MHVIIGPSRVLWGLLFTILMLIRFTKGRTVLTLRLHVTHGKLWLTHAHLDAEIVTVKFSYYAVTHRTTLHANCDSKIFVLCCYAEIMS